MPIEMMSTIANEKHSQWGSNHLNSELTLIFPPPGENLIPRAVPPPAGWFFATLIAKLLAHLFYLAVCL
jgi:hypothetical protein